MENERLNCRSDFLFQKRKLDLVKLESLGIGPAAVYLADNRFTSHHVCCFSVLCKLAVHCMLFDTFQWRGNPTTLDLADVFLVQCVGDKCIILLMLIKILYQKQECDCLSLTWSGAISCQKYLTSTYIICVLSILSRGIKWVNIFK